MVAANVISISKFNELLRAYQLARTGHEKFEIEVRFRTEFGFENLLELAYQGAKSFPEGKKPESANITPHAEG